MHKKLLTIFCFLFLVVFFSSVVNAQDITSTTSADRLKMQIEEIQEQKQTLKQQIKDRVQAKKEAVREAVTTKREEFRAKLKTIKDQKKKVLLERIDIKLSNVNVKHTDRFIQVLSNLQTILDKMSEDLDKTEAQAAIDAAKLAVENQAAKTYTITISNETALRSNVGTVTSQLRLDLVATHKAVVDAKQAVQTLRKDAKMKKEATNSANL